jgi:hypothetical protein
VPLSGPARRLDYGPAGNVAVRDGAVLVGSAMNFEPAEPTQWKRYRGGAGGKIWYSPSCYRMAVTGRGIDPSPAHGGRPSLFQPAVVGVGPVDVGAGDVGPGDVGAGDVSSAMPPMRGWACVGAVVVTGPAELPFSQADQDSCQ